MMRKVGIPFGRYDEFCSAPIDANKLGASTFCIFLETQSFKHQKMTNDQMDKFKHNLKNSRYKPENMIVHASYDLNLCEWDKRIKEKYQQRLLEELQLAESLGISLFNIHVGSCPNSISRDDSLTSASEMLYEAIIQVPNINISLENSVGSGARYGGQLEDINTVIDKLALKDQAIKNRLGFSLNIAHAFSYGYDFREQEKYDFFIDELDQVLGLEKLKLLFFNDSKTGFEQQTDTHENIGLGRMGYEPFKFFLTDKRLNHLPIIIETPDENYWKGEISFIKNTTKDQY